MLKVAIVDENLKVIKKVSKALKESGYNIVYTAVDGTDALKKNEVSPAQVILIIHPAMVIADESNFASNFWEDNTDTRIVFFDDYMLGLMRDSFKTYSCGIPNSTNELINIMRMIEYDIHPNKTEYVDPYIDQKKYKQLICLMNETLGPHIMKDLLKQISDNP